MIALFILSACIGTNTQIAEDQFQAVTAQEQLDTNTVVQAVQSGNIELCETVTNENQKTECKMKVEDQIIFNEAIGNMSLEKCDGIKEENTKEKCKIIIKDSIEKEELKAEELGSLQEQNELSSKFIKEDNLEGCESVEVENFKKDCIYNILIDRAIKSKDEKYCEQMEKDTETDECKSILQEQS